MSPNPQRTFVDPLLGWYDEHGRHRLPWREAGRSAFEVLLAEILLQRTTAAAVSGVYVSLVAQYPTPEAAVASPVSDLESLIAPLGLSKRATYIERCSGQLLARHSGCVPRTRSGLLELHGVGEYTARSVLVHSFDAELSAVDTNVERLVSRFFGFGPDARSVADFTDELVPPGRSSDFLYAMLDFAADVCTARSPECGGCPLEGDCDSSRT